ncbi:SusC/RagA family TonB-linked outer membrane protein [Puteibacter caeruleilacunae]|nr:SusC/RagA family TonB-linked outer membrane protein [Puteibacter caeruleilacunae]
MKKNRIVRAREFLALRKLLKVMRISIFIVLVTVMQSLAIDSYSQQAKLSLRMKNVRLEQVMDEIENRSDFYFLFNQKLVDIDRTVNVDVKSKEINAILDQLFEDTNVRYMVLDKQIVLSTSQSNNLQDRQAEAVVKGTVTDENGEGLPGVSVVVKGTTIGVTTNLDGKYELIVPAGSDVVVFSFVGMATQEIALNGKSTIDVVLQEDAIGLEEVVAVGYGTKKKSNLTGSVASVSAEEINMRATQSISSALSGTMSGVTVVQTSGAPGSQTGNITIRGVNSMKGGGPLVIVDGVQSSMDNIDVEDIENISVLKDAASAAIYGVTAANGVILITTKKGKLNQGPSVSYSNNITFSSPTFTPDFLGSADYAELYNEAYKNENPLSETVPFSAEDIQKFKDGSDPYGHPDTDWMDEVLKNNAFEQHHHIGISGGTSKTSFSGALSMLDQNGLISNIDYSRYNARTNIQSQINDRLSVGINMSAFKSEKNSGWAGIGSIYSWLLRTPPTVAIYNPDGSYSNADYQNPLAHIGNDGFRTTKQRELFAIFNAEYEVIDGLKVKGVYSLRSTSSQSKGFKNKLTYQNEDGTMKYDSGAREMYQDHYDYSRATSQVLANYNKSFNEHNIAVLAGYEQYEYTMDYLNGSVKNFSSNELYELNVGDKDTQQLKGRGEDFSRQSILGRVQYDYKGKYLFETNLRYDATSRFADGERWGLFPAVSAGWRISEEEFLQDASWLDNLKLRGGWGATGNQESGLYETVPTYSFDGKYILGNKLVTGINEGRYANTKLSWATVKSLEGAIEGSIYNGIFGWELAVFKKTTEDMILKLPVPSALGLDPPYQNAGELKNTGFDLSLTHANRFSNGFKYDVKLNFSYVKNELTDLKGTEGENDQQKKFWRLEGHPFESFYGFETEGYFVDQADIDGHATQSGNLAPGDLKYKDQNNDGKIDGDDRVVIGQNFPSYTMGFIGNASYKNFDLSLFFQGAFDVDVYYENEAAYSFFNGGKVLARHKDRWSPTNLDASYPRLALGFQHNYKTSDYWLEDGSYVRLKNIKLGYNIPKNIVSKLGIAKLKVYFSGENLLTFTKSEDFDPEAPSVNRGWFYGNVKKVSFGVKANF